jgi:hypothetical protein
MAVIYGLKKMGNKVNDYGLLSAFLQIVNLVKIKDKNKKKYLNNEIDDRIQSCDRNLH